MGIQARTHSEYIIERVKQRALGQTRIMWGLSGLAHKTAEILMEHRRATIDFAVDISLPSALRSIIVRQRVKTLSFEMGATEGTPFLVFDSTKAAIESLLRHIALKGLPRQTEAIRIKRSTQIPSSPHLANISAHSLDGSLLKEEDTTITISPKNEEVFGSFEARLDVSSKIIENTSFAHTLTPNAPLSHKAARNIVENMPIQNLISPTSLRGRLSDIVMQDEASVSRFKALTERFITLGKEPISLSAKARILKTEIDAQFPPTERASLNWLMRLGLFVSDYSPTLFYLSFKVLITQAAKFFIACENISSALSTINRLAKRNIGYIVDFVAEEATSPIIARRNLDRYLDSLDKLQNNGQEKMISIKLSGLVPDFNTSETHKMLAFAALDELMVKAKAKDAMVVIDMEQFYRLGITLDILEEYTKKTNYQYVNNLGIVNQTYLKTSLEVTQRLKAFARDCYLNTGGHGRLFVRFVKGAYPEFDKQYVLEGHEEANVRYIDCLRIALEDSKIFRISVASHNIRTITEAQEAAEVLGVDPKSLEFEMLLGMPAHPLLYSLANMGYKTRFYLPVGSFLESIGYFMRRMKENASSSSCQKLFREFQQGKISLRDYLDRAFAPIPSPPPPPIEEIPA